jgi:hypothetical protein
VRILSAYSRRRHARRTRLLAAVLVLASSSLLPLVARAADPQHLVTPFIEQRIALFMSPRVSIGGFGGGIGVEDVWNHHWVAEAHVNMLWGIGNVVSTHLAAGIQDSGFWQPGVRVTLGAFWGDRIEMLFDDGRRPSVPS